MPVSNLQEIHAGRDFNTDPDVETYTRVFIARTTLRHDEGFVIQEFTQSTGIQIGATHHKDGDAKCNAIRGNNSSGPFIWVITVGYSTDVTFTDNPINDPVDITWDDVFKSELTEKDHNDQVMTNSASDPYDKPISVDVGTKVATLNFNIQADTDLPEWVFDLTSATGNGRYVVNDEPVLIDSREIGLFQARFERAAVSLVKTRNKVRYRSVSCRVGYNPSSWQIDRLDEGFRQRDSDDNLVPIRESDGTRPSKPPPLDGDGHVLLKPTSATLQFRRFLLYKQGDLTVVRGIDAVPPTPPSP